MIKTDREAMPKTPPRPRPPGRFGKLFNEVKYTHDVTVMRWNGKYFQHLEDGEDDGDQTLHDRVRDYFNLRQKTIVLNGVVVYFSFGGADIVQSLSQGYAELWVLDMYSIKEHRWLTEQEIEGLASLMNLSPVPSWSI